MPVYIKRLIFLVSLIHLSGCTLTSTLVLGSVATSTWVTEPRSLRAIRRDNVINYHVNRKLANNRILAREAHITATSYNQVLLLTGQTIDSELREKAQSYAKHAPYVRQVFNQVTLSPQTTPWRRIQDAVITIHIKIRLFAIKGVHANQFEIITENGTVFILGVATFKQSQIATLAVQRTLGVKQVVKLIEMMY